MPSEITNYKCPACTGPLRFAGESGRMQCDYCGSSFTVEEIEALYAEKNSLAETEFEKTAAQQSEDDIFESYARTDWGEDADDMRAYSCPSCGAELMCDSTTSATACPYCGNPTIVPGQFTGTLKPDLIVPFALTKEEAKQALKNHFSDKKLLPKAFSRENQLDEIKGIYVPFWLYDADTDADFVFTGSRITRRWSDRDYDYVETGYFDLYRSGEVSFDNVPVDGSEKMDNTLMESLEPYDVTKAVEFKKAYLTGFFADRYDVNSEDCRSRAEQRIRNSTEAAFRATTAGYMTVTTKSSRVKINRGRAKYALLPVWILDTSWNGEKYRFAMNGQTGKFVGDLPLDKGAYWKWRFIYTGIFAAAIGAVLAAML